MEPSDEEVASLVQAAEGVLSELSSLSRSSGGDELVAGAGDVLAEGAVSVCCQFAERLNATNVESAVAPLEIALSTEIRKCFFCRSCCCPLSLLDFDNSSRQFVCNGVTIIGRVHTVSLFRKHFPGSIASV